MADLPRTPQFDPNKIIISPNPIRVVKDHYDEEIKELINLLFNESLSDVIRHAIRKYLTVAIFAALDFYFRSSARNLIDKNDLNVDSLFQAKSQKKLNKLIKENNTSKGSIVAKTYRFVDIFEIDFVFPTYYTCLVFWIIC